MHVSPTASRLLMESTAPRCREGRPLLSPQIQESSRGREGPKRSPAKSTAYCLCHEEGKGKAISFQSCHNLLPSGGPGSRGAMARRHPSHELRQEAIISCQNQSENELELFVIATPVFYQRSLDYRHSALQAQGRWKSVTRFCSDRKPLT